MPRNRIRSIIPWLILALVIAYGQYQTWRIREVVNSRAKWAASLTRALEKELSQVWTTDMQVKFAKLNGLYLTVDAMEPVGGRLPEPPPEDGWVEFSQGFSHVR